MCGLQSVWSVILKHKDFADKKRPPTFISNTKPTFNIVRSSTGARFVLVADVSLSMDEHVILTSNLLAPICIICNFNLC